MIRENAVSKVFFLIFPSGHVTSNFRIKSKKVKVRLKKTKVHAHLPHVQMSLDSSFDVLNS